MGRLPAASRTATLAPSRGGRGGGADAAVAHTRAIMPMIECLRARWWWFWRELFGRWLSCAIWSWLWSLVVSSKPPRDGTPSTTSPCVRPERPPDGTRAPDEHGSRASAAPGAVECAAVGWLIGRRLISVLTNGPHPARKKIDDDRTRVAWVSTTAGRAASPKRVHDWASQPHGRYRAVVTT